LATATYTLDVNGGRILLNSGYSWPTALRDYAAVEVKFTAGYGDDGTKVPDPIKQAILQHASTMYANKNCSDLPDGAKTLLDSFRLPESYGAW
jgi:uncharacterized phiE125 gp8 family phage protein